MQPVGEKLLKTVRDYAVAEPSFTCAFAAWDLSTNRGYKVSGEAVRNAVAVLEGKGIVEIVEDAGRAGKVYAYVPPPSEPVTQIRETTKFPELDQSFRVEYLASRGEPVAHTGGAIGPSGRPGRDRKAQAKGFAVKRARQGT